MDRETPCHLGRIGLHEKFLPFDLAPNILESTLDQVGVWLGSAIGKRERDVFFHDSLKSNEAAMKPSFWSRLLGFRIIQKRGNTKHQTDLSQSFEQLEARRLMALRIWDGGAITNDRWMDRQNWVSNVAPVAGDNLLFPDSIGFFDRSLNNNFPEGTAFGNVTFEGEGYLINGNRMTLNGNLIYAPESDIALPDSKLKLNMTFGSGNHEIKLVAGAVVNPDLKFINRLDDTGSGKITLSGNGTITFAGEFANDIDNHTLVIDNPGITEANFSTQLRLGKPDNIEAIVGILEIGKKGVVSPNSTTSFGTTSFPVGQIFRGSPITIRNNGVLEVSIETLNVLTMEGGAIRIRPRKSLGSGDFENGRLTIGGGFVNVNPGLSRLFRSDSSDGDPILLLALDTEFRVAAGGTLRIDVDVAGGDLVKSGEGNLSLSPPDKGNKHGDTIAKLGQLDLQGSVVGLTVVPHDLIVETGARVRQFNNNDQIADSAAVRILGGQYALSGESEETISELTIDFGGNCFVGGGELVVSGDVAIRNGSTFQTNGGGNVILGAVATIDNSTITADQAKIGLADIILNAGVVQTVGNNGNVTLTGQVSVLANALTSRFLGRLFISTGAHFFVVDNGAAASDLTIDAVIADRGGDSGQAPSLKKVGLGRLLLTANNTYTGITTVSQGILAINGQHSLGQGNTTVIGGILNGKGLVPRLITTGGVFTPGIGPGVFTAATSTNLGSITKFSVQVNGPTVGTDFDQLVTGQLTLGTTTAHPQLDVQLGFTPNVGQQFRIVNVTGNNVILEGQAFQDLQGNVLSEGAQFQVNGLNFTITYKGGNGNDVVITRNNAPAFENISITPEISEGANVIVTGHITEPDPNQSFFLIVDWGDGSNQQSFRFDPGTPLDIQVSHGYPDDPAGADDRYHVRLKWRDQFGGNNGAELTTIVRNSAPVIQAITASLPPLTVGTPFTLQGLFSDWSPRDTFKVFIQWNTNGSWQSLDLPAGATTFHFQHTYAKTGKRHVTVQIIDDDLDFAATSFVLDIV